MVHREEKTFQESGIWGTGISCLESDLSPPSSPHTSLSQADNPSFPNPRRRLRLQDLADRVVDASEDEHELNQLLNEALLERESAQV